MPSEIYSATYEMAQVLVDDVSLSDGISLLRCDYVPSILQVSEGVRINPTLDLNALWLSAAFQVTEVSMTSALIAVHWDNFVPYFSESCHCTNQIAFLQTRE